jgi:hypothetical protein
MAKQPLPIGYVRPLTAACVGQRALLYPYPSHHPSAKPTACSTTHLARMACVAPFVQLHPEHTLRSRKLAPYGWPFAPALTRQRTSPCDLWADGTRTASCGDIQCCSMRDPGSR